MADERKSKDVPVVEGEVVEPPQALQRSPTGRLVKRAPEPQLPPTLPAVRKPEFKLPDVDYKAIERRMLDTWAGGFIGACFDETEETNEVEHPQHPLIILTDKDE